MNGNVRFSSIISNTNDINDNILVTQMKTLKQLMTEAANKSHENPPGLETRAMSRALQHFSPFNSTEVLYWLFRPTKIEEV